MEGGDGDGDGDGGDGASSSSHINGGGGDGDGDGDGDGASVSSASTDLCEKVDGDCPDNCTAAGFNGTVNFVARLNISPFNGPTEAVAARAEA